MPALIIPFDGFARDIFGVMNMEKLLAEAERNRAPFLAMRNHVYEQLLDEGGREALRALAQSISDQRPRIVR